MALHTPTSPEFSWSPKKMFQWWMTPRATERDARFRELALRVSAFILLIVTVINIPVGIASTIAQDLTPDRILMRMVIYAASFAVLALAVFFIQRDYKVVAAWFILGIWILAFLATAQSDGLGGELPIAFLGFTVVYGQLILPAKHNRYLVGVLVVLIIATLFITPTDETNTLATDPLIAVIVALVFVMIINLLLSILRQELNSRQDELRLFVAELDQRVQDRTKELEIARQKAEEANIIKTKFLANMSHELRTPLNAILNFTAFVADGIMGDVNEEQEDALRQSISSGKHLLSLINDILDVTKIEAGLMDLFIQEVDFNEVLNGVVAIGKGLSKDKPVELATEIQANLPKSYGDKRRMRQVFLNIVSNAFKFTREGSVIIEAHSTPTHIRVKITDTGIGIAPENRDLVFESFKQVQHESLEVVGTGLGMPISKYFVESHLGKIWFESQSGIGTTFFVELPILTEDQANALRFDPEGVS